MKDGSIDVELFFYSECAKKNIVEASGEELKYPVIKLNLFIRGFPASLNTNSNKKHVC